MRVAALYDVHGNLPALEAVLADATSAADLVLVGGDVAAGPFPRETLALLRDLGERAVFVRGNADRASVPGLGDDERSFLASLPLTVTLDVHGLGPTLFCHATPRSDEEIVTAITPDERLREVFGAVAENTVVCGHTHVQFDRRAGSVRVVNAGSVGMPYEGRPGAYWALLGPDVALRSTEYDVERAAERIRASGYPGAGEWASEYVLHPHPAEEATEFFEQLATGAS